MGATGIFSVQQLRAMGRSRADIDAELRAGRLRRVRRGHYCTATANAELIRAVRLGGVATGPTALRAHGVWIAPGGPLHVLLPVNGSRLRDPDDARALLGGSSAAVHLHWLREDAVRPSLVHFTPVMPPLLALRHGARCMSGEMFIAAMDSALNQRIVTTADLRAMQCELPAHCAVLVDQVDARAQAGAESLVRIRLRRIGLLVEPQVRVSGVGSIHLLVEGVLGIETDGRATHAIDAQFVEDRRRDLRLAGSSYERLRLTQRQVLEQWPDCERAVLASVRRCLGAASA